MTFPTAQSQRIVLVGVLPGPRNGMTLVTQCVADALAEHDQLELIDLGRRYRRPGRRWQLRKAVDTVGSALRILLGWRASRSVVYLVGNSAGALPLSALQCLAARIRRHSVVYHHHTAVSITDHRMRLVVRSLPRGALHVVSCTDLERLLFDSFPGVRTLIVKPTIASLDRRPSGSDSTPRPESKETLVLGHLSNLTVEKGVLDVIATAGELHDALGNVRCIIAGPFQNSTVESLALAAAEQCPADVKFYGPVGQAERDAMLAELDVFLFPSVYANESWAMVIDEALAAGVPVITRRFPGAYRVVSETGPGVAGAVVADGSPFPSTATDLVIGWLSEDPTLALHRQAATTLGEALVAEAEGEFQSLLATMTDERRTSDA